MASVLMVLTMRDVVDDLRGVRQQFADPGAVLAGPRELEDGGRNRQRVLARGHAGDALALRMESGSSLPATAASFGL